MIEVAVTKSSPPDAGHADGGKGGSPRSGEERLIGSASGAAENIRSTVASRRGAESCQTVGGIFSTVTL